MARSVLFLPLLSTPQMTYACGLLGLWLEGLCFWVIAVFTGRHQMGRLVAGMALCASFAPFLIFPWKLVL